MAVPRPRHVVSGILACLQLAAAGSWRTPSTGVTLSILNLRHALEGGKGSWKLQPDRVARLMVNVEQTWNDQARHCSNQGMEDEDCKNATSAFTESCGKMARAIVQGSDGKKDVVEQYLHLVCEEHSLAGSLGDRCRSFEGALLAAMSDNTYDNREELDVVGVCSSFWQSMLSPVPPASSSPPGDAHAETSAPADDAAEVENEDNEASSAGTSSRNLGATPNDVARSASDKMPAEDDASKNTPSSEAAHRFVAGRPVKMRLKGASVTARRQAQETTPSPEHYSSVMYMPGDDPNAPAP